MYAGLLGGQSQTRALGTDRIEREKGCGLGLWPGHFCLFVSASQLSCSGTHANSVSNLE